MDPQPLVSVVIPTYNRRSLLSRAIESVRRQTYRHWEILVVDDGSVDDTIASIPPEPRIRVIQRPHCGNIATVRNVGLAAAAGTLVGFLDSDDRWRPEKLARQVSALLAAPAIVWCFCFYQLVDPEDQPLPLRAGTPTIASGGDLFPAVLGGRAGISLQTVLVRLDTARELLFDERVPFGEDFDFLVRLSRARPAVCVEGTLVDVLHHPGRSSRGRYDQALHLAAAFRRYRRKIEDPSLRSECLRQARRLTREYLARARGDGALITALARAGRMWASRADVARM